MSKFRRKARQKIPLTTNVFRPIVQKIKETVDNTNKAPVKAFSPPQAGPIQNTTQTINQSVLSENPDYTDEQVKNWEPHMKLSIANDRSEIGQAMTAAEVTERQSEDRKWLPQFFVNPMQDLDYIVIQAMLKNGFVGSLQNAFTRFIVGTGFRPELELINPDAIDKKTNASKIAENQEIIQTLKDIDRQLNTPEPGKLDVSFVDKVMALVDTTNSFNRAALIFSFDRKVKVNGKYYKEIPSGLKFAHPRDLGIIEVSPGSWKLEAVQWRNAYYMIPSKEMIYLWNPLITAKYHDAWWYGGSMMLPMLDASRVIRKIIGVDFPAMAEATWAGLFILTVKPEGQNETQKQTEYDAIASRMVRGGPNILMEDPANVSFNHADFTPRVNEFKDLVDFLIRYCVASMGLPQSMFFDESTSNRATMLGKIQLAISTVIEPIRGQFGRQICAQWYQRWFELIYKDKPELLQEFRIKMVWDDLHVEQWFDKIESVNEVDSRKQLTDEAYGEMSGIDSYVTKVEEDAITMPGGFGLGVDKKPSQNKTNEAPQGDGDGT